MLSENVNICRVLSEGEELKYSLYSIKIIMSMECPQRESERVCVRVCVCVKGTKKDSNTNNL